VPGVPRHCSRPRACKPHRQSRRSRPRPSAETGAYRAGPARCRSKERAVLSIRLHCRWRRRPYLAPRRHGRRLMAQGRSPAAISEGCRRGRREATQVRERQEIRACSVKPESLNALWDLRSLLSAYLERSLSDGAQTRSPLTSYFTKESRRPRMVIIQPPMRRVATTAVVDHERFPAAEARSAFHGK